MTLFGPLLEKRATIESPQVPLSAANVIDYFGTPYANASGVSVNETTVLGIPAVWRAVQIIAGTAASLPLHTFRNNTRARVVAALLDQPHPELTKYELWEWAYGSVALTGNTYLYKQRNRAGVITALLPIPPAAVTPRRIKNDPEVPAGKLFEIDSDGLKVVWSTYEVLHIPGFGYDGVKGLSPVQVARQSLGLTMAAEQHGARQFGSGNLTAGILQTDLPLTNDQARALKERWQRSVGGLGHSHEIAVLGSGAKFQSVQMPNDDAQFLESRGFQVSEIARWFGIPPHMLYDVSKSTSWGAGIEQQGIGFVVYTLRPWLTRFEQRITRELTPADCYTKFVVEGLLRGDSAARAAYYKTMRELGVFNADDILALEDRDPLPDGKGQDYLQPLNYAVVTGAVKPGAADAAAQRGADPKAIAELLQKGYLAVDKVITADELRLLANEAGASFDVPGPSFGVADPAI